MAYFWNTEERDEINRGAHAECIRKFARAIYARCMASIRMCYVEDNDIAAYTAGVVDALREKLTGNATIINSSTFPMNVKAYQDGVRTANLVHPL